MAKFVILMSLLTMGTSVDRKQVEVCINGGAEPNGLVQRDCLRASVPFRTDYNVVERCFRKCVDHWLNVSGLAANMAFHEQQATRGESPDLVDFGASARRNLLVRAEIMLAIIFFSIFFPPIF